MSRHIPPLVGMAEIGAMRDAKASTVSNWKNRYEDFPTPVVELACGDIYLRADAVAFLNRHPSLGGPRATIPEQVKADIRERISSGENNVTVLAERAGISRGSVYLIAGDLLFQSAHRD